MKVQAWITERTRELIEVALTDEEIAGLDDDPDFREDQIRDIVENAYCNAGYDRSIEYSVDDRDIDVIEQRED